MKLSFVTLLASCSLALFSCQKPSVQNIATPIPTAEKAIASGHSLEALQRGYQIYADNCARCHEHRLPNTITLPEWHSKIEQMSDFAGLTPPDRIDLQIYLSEFSDR